MPGTQGRRRARLVVAVSVSVLEVLLVVSLVVAAVRAGDENAAAGWISQAWAALIVGAFAASAWRWYARVEREDAWRRAQAFPPEPDDTPREDHQSLSGEWEPPTRW